MNIKDITESGLIIEGNGSADPDAMSLFRDINNNKLFKQCYSCSIRIYEDSSCFMKTDTAAVMCDKCGMAYRRIEDRTK